MLGALILSPTRELAAQIAKEAQVLTTFQPGMKIVTVVGGTNIGGDKKRMGDGTIDMLIATPGRLIDHLGNTRGFKERASRLAVLIMDEADQLLEMGFRPDIEKILA